MKWAHGIMAVLCLASAILWMTRSDVFWIIWSLVFAVFNGYACYTNFSKKERRLMRKGE